MTKQYWHGAHTTHRLKYHLVWTPKYRRRVLQGEVAARIKGLFYNCVEINQWYLEELEVMPDHIHMLIQLPPSLSVSKVVQLLKGGSSKVIRAEHPELEEFLWGDSFWADGYFAESVGINNEATIKKYIQDKWANYSMSDSEGGHGSSGF
jgi:putative transposase